VSAETGSDAAGEAPIRRLNWGCGGYPHRGWINSDKGDYPGVDIVCDILEGLPLENDSIDYAASTHALPEIAYPELVPAVRELYRVLKPRGVLRLCLPDLDKGIQAYLNGDREYFLVPDEDAQTIGGKFVTQIIWYGYSRTLFTYDFTEELLLKAGFSSVVRCAFEETKSPFPEIIHLDSREHESLFVEGTK
jgi:SAM-dependent methyltransferase